MPKTRIIFNNGFAPRASAPGARRNSVTLLAVSKTHPPETIREAADCGQLLFGENKIQEAKAKIPLCPGKCRWHFIGHLQSNKVRDAVELFEMIQGVDSLALAREINKRCEQAAKTMPVSAGSERRGRGEQVRLPAGTMLLAELNELNALPKIEIHGLMAIPPYTTDAGKGAALFPPAARIENATARKSSALPCPI